MVRFHDATNIKKNMIISLFLIFINDFYYIIAMEEMYPIIRKNQTCNKILKCVTKYGYEYYLIVHVF